jgi:AraC family transcriptional regulator, exoenzyme S synthesis regulatory protein ExsA
LFFSPGRSRCNGTALRFLDRRRENCDHTHSAFVFLSYAFRNLYDMNIVNLPDHFFQSHHALPELNIFIYEVRDSSNKSKINMSKHVLSFLMEGQKEVHFSNKSVSINTNQSLLIASGNFLMTEHIGNTYFRCLLFFFPQECIENFFLKYPRPNVDRKTNIKQEPEPYFRVEKDDFIRHFINSLEDVCHLQNSVSQKILGLKFEEIILYLTYKYNDEFLTYLKSLLVDERKLSFKTIVEKNVYTNLNLEEIAFLCNMSLSTFKRQFVQIYQVSPGKWFQRMRLNKAREILNGNKVKPSEIYMDFGYDSLSNFSAAFKNEFGYSPKQLQSL